jgi:hypothetical protein
MSLNYCKPPLTSRYLYDRVKSRALHGVASRTTNNVSGEMSEPASQRHLEKGPSSVAVCRLIE